jgi:hypothetical protein
MLVSAFLGSTTFYKLIEQDPGLEILLYYHSFIILITQHSIS